MHYTDKKRNPVSAEDTGFLSLSKKYPSRLSVLSPCERILAGHAESCWDGRQKSLNLNASGNSLPGSITLRGPQAEISFVENEFFDKLRNPVSIEDTGFLVVAGAGFKPTTYGL